MNDISSHPQDIEEDVSNVDEMTNFGLKYWDGEAVPQDYVKDMEWYQKAAALGNSDAMTNIGTLYYYGRGVDKDFARSGDGGNKPLRWEMRMPSKT